MKERINKLFMDLNEHDKLESECNYLERLSKYGSTIIDAVNFVVWAITIFEDGDYLISGSSVDAWISQSIPRDTIYATFNPFNEAGLLNLLELYEAECYADSVENGYLVGMYWEDGICKTEKYYSHNIPYRHREPTFTEFIEFLKRRKQ